MHLRKNHTISFTVPAVVLCLLIILMSPGRAFASEKEADEKNITSEENTDEKSDSEQISGYSETEDRIYSVLRKRGYSHEGACGILGNVAVENPNFDADLEANNGLTYGLFQWTNDGDRRSNLISWCNNRSIYPNRVDGQLAFALYELEGGDPIAKRCNDYLIKADNARNAAMEFAVGFERCIGETTAPEKDGKYTGEIYPEFSGMTYQALNERMNKAEEYEAGYRDFDGWKDEDILLVNEADKSLVKTPLKMWLFSIASVIIGYLLGCLNYTKLFGEDGQLSNFKSVHRLLAGRDEATESKVLDTLLGILFDVIKTYAAILICYLIFGKILCADVIAIAGLGVLLGNDFPVWNKGRGGFGTAVAMLMLCTYLPIWGLVCIAVGVITIRLSKSLPLGTVICPVVAVPFAFVFKGVLGGIIISLVALVIVGRRVIEPYIGKRRNGTREKEREIRDGE